MLTVVFMFSLSVSLASTVLPLYLCELCFLLKKNLENFCRFGLPIAVNLIIQW